MEVVPLLPLSRSEITGTRPRFLQQLFDGKLPDPAETLRGNALLQTMLSGFYPEVLTRNSAARRAAWYRQYINAVTQRDVRDIAEIARLDDMPRLIGILARLSGQLLNLSEIGGALKRDHKTVDRYVGILEQLFLVHRLQPWARNELKRMVKTPKLHVPDTGLLAAMRQATIDRLHKNPTLRGPLFESLVLGELQKQAGWRDDPVSIFFYRDKDQVEIDFILEDAAGDLVGIEVKAAATVAREDFYGLRRLAAAAGPAFRRGIVLFDGERVLPFGDEMYAVPFASLWS